VPRCHILCWYSEPRAIDRDFHRAMLARLNGALGGSVLNAESLPLSQGFFIGSVVGGHPVEILDSEGSPIDTRDDLDHLANDNFVNASKTTATNRNNGLRIDKEVLLQQIRSGTHWYQPTLSLAGICAFEGVPLLDAKKLIEDAFAAAEPDRNNPRLRKEHRKWQSNRDKIATRLLLIYGKQWLKEEGEAKEAEDQLDQLDERSGAAARNPSPGGASGGGGGGSGGSWVLPPPEDDERDEGDEDERSIVDVIEQEDDPAAKLRGGVSLNDFFAIMPAHKYAYIPNRELWPAETINGRFPKVEVQLATGETAKVQPAKWLDMHRPVEQMVWAPGRPLVIDDRLINEGGWIERNGVRCFNLYLPPSLRHGDARKAQPWLDHVRLIYPSDADHIVVWLAHRVQRPHEKINHALILSGHPGIGKDTLLEPVRRAIGPWNFREASPPQVMGRYNGFLKGVILRISEIKDLGETDRFKFYEHIKGYTAAPPDVLRCDEKYIPEHSILNVCGIVYTTNYKAEGLYLPADDRRHYVAWSAFKKEDFPASYWTDIWSFLDSGGDRHVAAYLAGLDLSDFNPKAPPPLTDAFWDVVNAHRAPEDAELLDTLESYAAALRARHQPDADFVKRDGAYLPRAVTLRLITPHASDDFKEWLEDRKNRRVIPHRFESCHYTPVRNDAARDGLWKIKGRREVVYAPEELSRSDQMTAAAELK
jgi:hypothetical protein